MAAAEGFVGFVRADEDDRVLVGGGLAVDDALRSRGVLAADHADGVQLLHLLRLGQEQYYCRLLSSRLCFLDLLHWLSGAARQGLQ